MISFCVWKRAKSYNNRGRSLQYTQAIVQAFLACRQPAFDATADLYSRVYYFHSERSAPDADNLNKPIVDALTGHAYDDDKQIVFRSSASLDMRRDFRVDFTNLSGDMVADMAHAILEGNPFIYIEIGRYSNDFIQFGG